MKNILILNDFVSKGKIAGNMMSTVLSYKNYNVYFLPTALISNNFSYGEVSILNTNSYIEESLRVRQKLRFSFDAVFIGFIENNEQKEIIKNLINKVSDEALIILDPIMGDDGKIYQGVGDEKIGIYKDIMEISDIIMPNFTEAMLLNLDDYEKLKNNDRDYIITSLKEDDKFYNLGISDNLHKVYFDKLDIHLSGTGDLFDAIFLYRFLETDNLNESIEYAVSKINKILIKQKEDDPDGCDIHIESYLNLLD